MWGEIILEDLVKEGGEERGQARKLWKLGSQGTREAKGVREMGPDSSDSLAVSWVMQGDPGAGSLVLGASC